MGLHDSHSTGPNAEIGHNHAKVKKRRVTVKLSRPLIAFAGKSKIKDFKKKEKKKKKKKERKSE